MHDLILLFIHILTTLVRLSRPEGPGGVRSVMAGSVLMKHQLLVFSRSRRRAPKSPRVGPTCRWMVCSSYPATATHSVRNRRETIDDIEFPSGSCSPEIPFAVYVEEPTKARP